MSYYLTRQRCFTDNCLYIEIAIGGPKNSGKDILPVKYYGEQKNLVDPRDAVSLAASIYKQWEKDYWDEQKRLKIIGGIKDPISIYEFTAKGIAAATSWADKTFANMKKCAACNKAMGNRDPFQHDDLGDEKVFCTEYCCAKKYRDMFGVEMPRITSNKSKGSLLKKI